MYVPPANSFVDLDDQASKDVRTPAWQIIDTWSDRIPVTKAEIQIVETYLGRLIDLCLKD